jgi:hypothetical protein
MAEVASDFHSELNDVLSKVNSWALGREKELLSLQTEHTSFLDTHNGASVHTRSLHEWAMHAKCFLRLVLQTNASVSRCT